MGSTSDIKFRIQGPTVDERAGFDNAVLNWFGFVCHLVWPLILIPTLAVVFLMFRSI